MLTTKTHSKHETKDIHEYDFYRKQSIMRQIDNVLMHKDLIEEQRDVIKDYYKYISIGIRIKSLNSVLAVLKSVRWFAEFIKKPFNEATKEDIINFVHYKKRKGNSDNYINQCLIYLKAFYKWYMGGGETYPDIVKWMKPRCKPKKINYSELLTWEDIDYLMDYCYLNRDKSILYLLRDTGGRIEETILRPKIKDLIPDEYGFKLRVNGKTGERYIRLLNSIPVLKVWLNEHKYKDNPEAPLFYVVRTTQKTKGEPIKYPTIETMFCRLKKSSGINKPINPHAFRHASATERAMQGFQEKELRVIYGWAANSNMPEVYCNFTEKEVDRKILEKSGRVIKQESDVVQLKQLICPKCHAENMPTALYCECGMSLNLYKLAKDIERREEADKEMNQLFAEPEFRDLLKSYLKKKQQQT